MSFILFALEDEMTPINRELEAILKNIYKRKFATVVAFYSQFVL